MALLVVRLEDMNVVPSLFGQDCVDSTVLLWRSLEGLSSAGWNATLGTLRHCNGRCVTHGCSEPRLSVTHAVRTETPIQTSMDHLVKRGPGADHESLEGGVLLV